MEISEQPISQEVILKAEAGKLKWWEASEIMGVTDRTMRAGGSGSTSTALHPATEDFSEVFG